MSNCKRCKSKKQVTQWSWGEEAEKKKKSKKMPEALQQYARLFCLIATHNSFRVIICCGMTNILHLKLLYLLRDEAKHS